MTNGSVPEALAKRFDQFSRAGPWIDAAFEEEVRRERRDLSEREIMSAQ